MDTNQEHENNEPTPSGQLSDRAMEVLDGLGGLGIDTNQLASELAPQAPAETPPAPQEPLDAGSMNPAQQVFQQVQNNTPEDPSTFEANAPEVQSPEAPEVPEANTPAQGGVSIESEMFEGGSVNIGGNQKPNEEATLSFENNDAFTAHIKGKYGIEDASTFFQSADKWRKQSQELSQTKSDFSQIQETIQTMPDELYNAFIAHAKGEDWKTEISSNGVLDYSKDSSSYEAKALIENIFPGQLTDSDWEAFNDPDHESHDMAKRVVDTLTNQAKSVFDNKKANINAKRADYLAKAERDSQLFSESVVSSVKHFKQSFPFELSQKYVDTLQNDFKSGGLNKLFYNEDGSVREDAMLNFAMAKQGMELLTQYKAIAENAAKTSERQEFLDRTPEEPVRKTSGEVKEVRPEVQREMDDLMAGLEIKNTF